MDPIQAVLQQVDVSEADARAALEKTQQNVTEAILYLYNVPPPTPKPATEWDERRSICDAYEEQMHAFSQRHSTVSSATPDAPPTRTIQFPAKDAKAT